MGKYSSQSRPFILPIDFAWCDSGKSGWPNVTARQSGRHTKHASQTVGPWQGSKRQARVKYSLGGSLYLFAQLWSKAKSVLPHWAGQLHLRVALLTLRATSSGSCGLVGACWHGLAWIQQCLSGDTYSLLPQAHGAHACGQMLWTPAK